MPEYDHAAARKFRVIRSGLKPPSSNWVDIRCPFCGAETRAYVWSLSGGGKKCPDRKCGAKHGSDGFSSPLKAKAAAEKAVVCLIWSNEHRAWWGPNNAGYVLTVDRAGRYTLDDAIQTCAFARDGWRPGEPPPEIPVRLDDALAAEAAFEARRAGGR